MKIARRINWKRRVHTNVTKMATKPKKRSVVFREVISSLQKRKEAIEESATYFPNFGKYKKYLQRATKDDLLFNGSFHEAIAPVLMMAQCFAVMPVKGLKSKDAKGLSFSWFYFPTFYSIIAFLFLTCYFCLTLNYTMRNRFNIDNIDPIIFYVSILFVFYTFGSLARKWPELMQKWEDIENKLPSYQSHLQKAALAHKIKMITLVVMVLSLSEHVLNIISIIHYSNYCNTTEDPIKYFFLAQLSQLFYVTNFAAWKAFFGKMLTIIATFVWNYTDVFIMVMSVGLSEKFRQVNESMFRVKGKIVPQSFWCDHRVYYRNLCNLCDDVDSAISIITMVSFSNNLYFILVQLLKSLNELPSFAHYLYFWFSLIFLIGRTLAVSLYSAEINDESKRPIEVFRCVPKESWCLEVKRFSEEVNSDIVALSGKKFFHLTRKLVLSVAGTIVTYELVLIQFHVDDKKLDC